MESIKYNNLIKMCLSFVLFIVACTVLCFLYAQNDCYAQRKYLIIKKDGSYSNALREIIKKYGLSTDETLTDLVEKTQKSQADGGWIRQPGKERWEIEKMDVGNATWHFECFTGLGLIDEVKPLKKQYRYALVFGATVQGMRLRFAYLLELIETQGIEVETIVFLVGKRKRSDAVEGADILYTQEHSILPFSDQWQRPDMLPETETDLARLIIEQTALPDSIKNNIIVIDAPCHVHADGTITRPNTEDTVHAWLSQNPTAGTILCISNQPHIDRQLFVIQKLLPEWNIECVGPAVKSNDFNIAILFDSLARSLWELDKIRK
jgi:hypothetical protein